MRRTNERWCHVENCKRPYYAKTFCRFHYDRTRKRRDPELKKNAREYKRRKYADDPVHRNKVREYQCFRKHGLTLAQKAERIRLQGHRCAICGSENPGGLRKDWKTDHDHVTEGLRGELCNRCNLLLGQVGDDRALLAKLIDYLWYWNKPCGNCGGCLDCLREERNEPITRRIF